MLAHRIPAMQLCRAAGGAQEVARAVRSLVTAVSLPTGSVATSCAHTWRPAARGWGPERASSLLAGGGRRRGMSGGWIAPGMDGMEDPSALSTSFNSVIKVFTVAASPNWCVREARGSPSGRIARPDHQGQGATASTPLHGRSEID